MQFLTYGAGGFFWLICYFFAIWICVIGKKKNPNRGWNLIIVAEVIYIIVYLPPHLLQFFGEQVTDYIFVKKFYVYLIYISMTILPVGMILFLVGLYYIAQGKKKTPKKKRAIKKRRVK